MAILCILVGKFAIKNINEQFYDESESATNEKCLPKSLGSSAWNDLNNFEAQKVARSQPKF
jgi:hypothetical protein